MKWKQPPIIKVYEALGSLGDGRVKVDGDTAKVYSSSGNKYYDVIYDPDQKAITANDNGSHWLGYLGYPSVSFLLATGKIKFDEKLPEYLAGFPWKDINQKYKNDFAKTQAYIDQQIEEKHHANIEKLHQAAQTVLDSVMALDLNRLPNAKMPPTAY